MLEQLKSDFNTKFATWNKGNELNGLFSFKINFWTEKHFIYSWVVNKKILRMTVEFYINQLTTSWNSAQDFSISEATQKRCQGTACHVHNHNRRNKRAIKMA